MSITSVRGILPEASGACLAECDIPATTGRDPAMCLARTCQRVVQTSRRCDTVASRPRIYLTRPPDRGSAIPGARRRHRVDRIQIDLDIGLDTASVVIQHRKTRPPARVPARVSLGPGRGRDFLPVIQQLLGHSSLATTATYVSHIAPPGRRSPWRRARRRTWRFCRSAGRRLPYAGRQ